MPSRVPSASVGQSHHAVGTASTSAASSASASQPATSTAPAARRRDPQFGELLQRQNNAPRVSAANVHAAQAGTWNVESAINDMAGRSSDRHTRWLKKSASPQYLYAKALTARQRGQLERALERRFRNPAATAEHRDAALTMWLSVQQARLRTHTSGHRHHHNVEQFETAVWSVPIPLMALGYRTQRRRYYSSPLRPEYRAAFNNFMRVIGDPSLSQATRQQVAAQLEYHWRSEETIARHERAQLEQQGVMGLAESGYQVSEDFEHARLTALERQAVIQQAGRGVPPALYLQALETEQQRAQPGSIRAESLARQLASVRAAANAPARASTSAQASGSDDDAAARLRRATADDIQRQRRPLGSEIKAWLKLAGGKSLPDAKAFDHEADADAFARLLERRRPGSLIPFLASRDPVVADGAMVIRAIAKDADLRKSVFSAAETALGSCGDNVVEGFSNIVTMVDTHELVAKVRSGEIDQPKLESWARQRYRLDSLITEVNQMTARSRNREGRAATVTDRQLEREPVETMLHAKVALKKELDLPKNIPSRMMYPRASVLGKATLKRLAETVRAKEADPAGLAKYLLSNDSWRTAMQTLHSAAFTQLKNRFAPEKAALAEEAPPQPTDAEGLEFLEERVAYAERTQVFTQKVRAAEDRLLLRLSGRGVLVQMVVGAGPSQGGR
ncbi:NEL-type E3 ubiquitin ligase domain-containing protein [Ralstonia solanacearum]|uniref:NEL-type E3 ubiquitin ligase domain-containing protein n=1 Tax=Ralstonia solanacearum TaxID=305 RepID=UPI0018679689|nr:NEL-type E3 ubiquitin ligase domain-containing protein [Ralstonia solanacearum]QOK82440.1 type III effector protein [Ralstonia solanacearum]